MRHLETLGDRTILSPERDIRLVDLGQAINPRGLASYGSQSIVQGTGNLL